jgi:hypothetical protein
MLGNWLNLMVMADLLEVCHTSRLAQKLPFLAPESPSDYFLGNWGFKPRIYMQRLALVGSLADEYNKWS